MNFQDQAHDDDVITSTNNNKDDADEKHVTFTEASAVVIDDVISSDDDDARSSSADDVSDKQAGSDSDDVTRRQKTQLIHVERERPTSAFDFHPLRNQKLKLNSGPTQPPATLASATDAHHSAPVNTDVTHTATSIQMTSSETNDVNKDSARDTLMLKRNSGADDVSESKRHEATVGGSALCMGVASVLIFIAFCGLVVIVILYVTR